MALVCYVLLSSVMLRPFLEHWLCSGGIVCVVVIGARPSEVHSLRVNLLSLEGSEATRVRSYVEHT